MTASARRLLEEADWATRQWAPACSRHSGLATWGGGGASPRASAGVRSGAPEPRVSTVHEGASEARRPGPVGIPNCLEGEGGSEGEDEHVDEADLGAALRHMGPWNRRVFPSHSGNGSEARSSYCPRRMEGSSVGC